MPPIDQVLHDLEVGEVAIQEDPKVSSDAKAIVRILGAIAAGVFAVGAILAERLPRIVAMPPTPRDVPTEGAEAAEGADSGGG